MKNSLTYRIALASAFTALVFLATLIAVPIGLGYINLGDTVIFASSLFLGFYAVPVAIIGSCLADFVIYPLYVPATAIIKGTMSFICSLLVKLLVLKGRVFSRMTDIEPINTKAETGSQDANSFNADKKESLGAVFLKLLIIFLVGSLFMQAGYIVFELMLFALGNEEIESIATVFAFAKLLASSFQTIICVPLATVLSVLLIKNFSKYFVYTNANSDEN